MDFFFWTLIFVAISGITLIVASVFSKEQEAENGEANNHLLEYINLNTKIKDIDESISEADNVITEINDVSKNVFKEIDDKYQELLFLYNLIDEKKKMLAAEGIDLSNVEAMRTGKPEIQLSVSEPKPVQKAKSAGFINPFTFGKRSKIDISVSDATKKAYTNPKLDEIIGLYEEGFDVPEIAKKLGLGSGEVALIMTLGKSSLKTSSEKSKPLPRID